jgi:hypothetical protein
MMKKVIQSFLIALKMILILFLILIKLNIIKDRPLHLIVEFIFYVVLGLYIIYLSYPLRKKPLIMDHHDNILLFALGIIFLLTIDYQTIFLEIKELYLKKK